MNALFTRRDFSKTMAEGLSAATHAAATPRNLKIGHTCSTWRSFPRGPEAIATLQSAAPDISALGYNSFETFPEILEECEKRDALKPLIEKYNLTVGRHCHPPNSDGEEPNYSETKR